MTGSVGRLVNAVLDTVAAGWLISIAMLLCWSMAPMALGWRPNVVLTQSMMPAIKPGDVVLTSPVGRVIKPGTVVVVTDLSVRSGRVIHRVTGRDDVGRLITKGDANRSQDSTPRLARDVLGMGRLVVPGVGRVSLLRTGHATTWDWVWVWATVASAGWLALPASRHPSRQGQNGVGVKVGMRLSDG